MPEPPSNPKVEVPILKDLTIDNITENVHRINSQASDARLKYILERLVSHMHDFARETRLSTQEWLAGIDFLTQVGQKCTDVRQVSSTQTAKGSRIYRLNISVGIYPPL
jgi:hypothetical protein